MFGILFLGIKLCRYDVGEGIDGILLNFCNLIGWIIF